MIIESVLEFHKMYSKTDIKIILNKILPYMNHLNYSPCNKNTAHVINFTVEKRRAADLSHIETEGKMLIHIEIF
jgi:hypothetical protein